MDVGHKYPSFLFGGKSIGLINPRASMCRAVAMVRDGFDVVVHIGVKMLSTLAVVYPARHNVPQMRNNTGRDEQLPLGIIIDPPGIAETMGHDFEAVFYRVVTPDPAV